MKKLEINDKTLYYKIIGFDCGEYGVTTCYKTYFFLEPKMKVKKYWLWGSIIEIENTHEVFMLDYSIEEEWRTKLEIREDLEYRLELLNRKEEIKRGEII